MYEIMKHLHNFFALESVKGVWTVDEDGNIDLPFLVEGQYFLVEGSNYNDFTVFEYGTDELNTESFEGYIVPLKVPAPFVELCTEIKDYMESAESKGVFTSESFGGYSYTKATGANGAPISWQGLFKERLNVWRKL